jgi:hypothetical protein
LAGEEGETIGSGLLTATQCVHPPCITEQYVNVTKSGTNNTNMQPFWIAFTAQSNIKNGTQYAHLHAHTHLTFLDCIHCTIHYEKYHTTSRMHTLQLSNMLTSGFEF